MVPTAAVGVSFGVLAAAKFGVLATVVMSAVVWSGTGQFAALNTITSGAGIGLAAFTGLLANTRFLPMGFAIAPSLTGRALRRAATGATLADASFVIGHRGEGRFDVAAVVWAAPLQYLAWVGGTIAGAVGASLISDPNALGLDVLFPVFYLSLLLPELRGRGRNRARVAAAVATVLTIAATPFAPPGIAVLVASTAALIGLRR